MIDLVFLVCLVTETKCWERVMGTMKSEQECMMAAPAMAHEQMRLRPDLRLEKVQCREHGEDI